VAGRADEPGELLVGHRARVDVEGADPHPVHRRLLGVEGVRAHGVRAPRQRDPFARAARGGAGPQRRAAEIEAATAEVREALEPAMPRLRACYQRALPELGDPNVTLEVDLTLTGDPDVGTLIEADVLLDPKRRFPGTMVACLRSELQLLELPPLVSGDALTIRYPFGFGAD
jgi:hypothetical protein